MVYYLHDFSTTDREVDELAVEDRYFEHPVNHRLAFREFGTCMGVGCVADVEVIQDRRLPSLRAQIIRQWENAGVGHQPVDVGLAAAVRKAVQRQGLKPITMVMYAAAVLPGGAWQWSLHKRCMN